MILKGNDYLRRQLREFRAHTPFLSPYMKFNAHIIYLTKK